MIPSQFRLKLSPRSQFIGTKSFGHWVLVIVSQSEIRLCRSSPQWAVRVGKKIDARAVVRNRLRRQLTHWLYREREHLKPQQSLIILLKKPEQITDIMGELKHVLFV